MEPNKKVTIYDLADALGVSVATVNRALHDKPRVSPETRRRILELAEQMNFKANRGAQSLRRNPIQIGAILLCPVPQFLADLERGVRAALESLRELNVESEVFSLCCIETDPRAENYFSPKELCAKLEDFAARGFDGIVLLTAATMPGQVAACVRALQEQGVAFATVVTDNPRCDRALFVGGDGVCAGSLAAELLWRFCRREEVALLICNHEIDIHRQNLEGFSRYREAHPLNVVGVYEHFDDPDRVQRETDRMLREHPGLSGVYMSSASSLIACQRIVEAGFGGKIRIVTTDLFAETRSLMQSDVICASIFQNPYRQGRECVERLYEYLSNRTGGGSYHIVPQVVFESNIGTFYERPDGILASEH